MPFRAMRLLALAAVALLKIASPISRVRAELRTADMARDVTDAVRATRKPLPRKRPRFTVPRRSISPRK